MFEIIAIFILTVQLFLNKKRWKNKKKTLKRVFIEKKIKNVY